MKSQKAMYSPFIEFFRQCFTVSFRVQLIAEDKNILASGTKRVEQEVRTKRSEPGSQNRRSEPRGQNQEGRTGGQNQEVRTKKSEQEVSTKRSEPRG